MAEDESTLTVEVRLRLRPLVQADLAKDFVPLLEQLTVVGSIPSVPMLPLLPSPPSPPPPGLRFPLHAPFTFRYPPIRAPFLLLAPILTVCAMRALPGCYCC